MLKPQPIQPGRLSPLRQAEFNRRSNELANAPDSAAVEPLCRQFLRDFPDQPLAHFLLARALFETRKIREAFPYAEAAHRLAPADPNYAYYLGLIHLELSLYEHALPLLKQAAASVNSNTPLYQEALALCFHEIGQTELAVPLAQKALEQTRGAQDRNRLTSMIASFLVLSGKIEDAKPYIAKIAALGGAQAKHAALLEARSTKDGANSPIGKKLTDILSHDDLESGARSDLLLALGNLYEKDKEYDKAFECWKEARASMKEEGAEQRKHAEILHEMKRLFTPELYSQLNRSGHPSEEPIFIAGMPRSGTTLTEQIIASHPDAAGTGELTIFTRMARVFLSDYAGRKGRELLVANAKKGELRNLAEEGLKLLRMIAGRPVRRIAEKTPHNFLAVGYLHLCFPNAKFIHCYRNPMDSFVSSYQNALNRAHSYAYSQETYCDEYLWHVELMKLWKSLFPERILTLHYEQLASDPETWARKIIEFTGLPWHDDCLRFFEKAGTVRTISSQQVRKPVYSSSIERWRRYETHLQPLVRALEKAGFQYRVGEV